MPALHAASAGIPSSSGTGRARLRRATVAASVVLLGALVCGVAPAASAAPSTAPPGSAAPSGPAAPINGSVAGEHPGLDVTVSARFVVGPLGRVEAGSPITLTYTFTNTGDVPLQGIDTVRTGTSRSVDISAADVGIEPGSSTSVISTERTVTAGEAESGVVTVADTWSARSPRHAWQFRPNPTFFLLR